MKTEKNRIDTIKAIVCSNLVLNSMGKTGSIHREFTKVINVKWISDLERKHLLKILHSTRAWTQP